MLSIPTEQLHDFFHAKLACILVLATFNGLFGEFAFLFLQFEDTLFDAVGDCDLVDYYADLLGQAVDAVDGLFFYKLGDVKDEN